MQVVTDATAAQINLIYKWTESKYGMAGFIIQLNTL